MNEYATFGDVHVSLGDDYVALAEIRRPPNNFFSQKLIAEFALGIRTQ